MPLFLVECYLILTVILYFFGPVVFSSHDTIVFIALIVLYHISFIAGYSFSTNLKILRVNNSRRALSNRFYYIAFFFGVVGVLNTYKNLMLAPSIIPYDILSEVLRGINEPGSVYAGRMQQVLSSDNVSSSRLFNIASIFFSFFKLLFIFIFVYYWSDLSIVKKTIAIVYSFLFISGGIASGTNSVIFIFFIFLLTSAFISMYLSDYKHLKKILIMCLFLFLIPIGLFGYMMSQRGGGFDYFAGTSPLGDISIAIDTPSLTNFIDFYYYSFVWLNYYLVQGYYGFSLILDLDFNWTYGFGNSAFLQRQLLVITGVDISEMTYQARISDYWDKDAQWHSFYGQFANDFSLLGMSVLMFLLGFLLSRVWLTVIHNNSFFGAALLPIFIILFVFFPANNQVFGYIDTFSYFIFVSIFWFFEHKKIRWKQ